MVNPQFKGGSQACSSVATDVRRGRDRVLDQFVETVDMGKVELPGH
jgi:hypothetical protein